MRNNDRPPALPKADHRMVTLYFAPDPWLVSINQVLEVRVWCVVKLRNQWLTVELAAPSWPPELGPGGEFRPEMRTDNRTHDQFKRTFLKALHSALEIQEGIQVYPFRYNRIDWGETGGE